MSAPTFWLLFLLFAALVILRPRRAEGQPGDDERVSARWERWERNR